VPPSFPKGTVIEYRGIKFTAADDQILGLLSDAAIFEKAETASLHEAIRVAVGCARLIPTFTTEKP
jgi:hypothetical protein